MLTRFSKKVAEAVFKHHPEWRGYETTDLGRDGKYHYFSVEIPPINPKVKKGLWIITNGPEITVYFDEDHRHFCKLASETPREFIQRAIDYAETILADRSLALSWWIGDRLCLTTSQKGGRVSPHKKYTKNWNEWSSFRARSWSGKRDCDIQNPISP